MSDPPLPAPLRIPDISRFLNRANQLRAIKPAAAYWCSFSRPCPTPLALLLPSSASLPQLLPVLQTTDS